jgi:hypothetical protein
MKSHTAEAIDILSDVIEELQGVRRTLQAELLAEQQIAAKRRAELKIIVAGESRCSSLRPMPHGPPLKAFRCGTIAEPHIIGSRRWCGVCFSWPTDCVIAR